ncbi:MAG: hypothetical protein SFX72_19380 [Isosphaeraceae bacterium]|nr:hypothetical protein [Isosphaeraceae bacterium]
MQSMRIMRIALMMSTVAACGCSSVPGLQAVAENPLAVPSADFETVWHACVSVLDDYFEIATENRLQRKIVTQPKIASTLAEPWRGDSVGFEERLEASLQTIRRFAIVTVNPTPTGTFAVKVEVYKELEDLVRPEKQSNGRAVFDNEYPVNRAREVVGPVPLPSGWIPRGRDHKLEQAILAKIKSQLFL